MYSTLPEHPRPANRAPQDPEARRSARRSRGRRPLSFLVIGLLGAVLGIVLALGLLLLSHRIDLSAPAPRSRTRASSSPTRATRR